MKRLKASGGHARTTGKKRWNCVGWIVFLCYIAGVFGVTLIHRGNYFGKSIYPLFYSYKSAWYHFSKNEWQNLVYNIFLFLPYGMLLPLLILRMRRWWKVTLCVFGTSLLIEIVQLVCNRGVFECDDLLNNTVGGMIGYGLFVLIWYVVQRCMQRKGQQNNTVSQASCSIRKVLCLQVPLFGLLFAFACVGVVYSRQDLGNLASHYLVRQKVAAVETQVPLLSEGETRMVYQTPILSEAETRELVQTLFAIQGDVMDESRIDLYQDTAVYYSVEKELSVWYDYKGGTFSYTDFQRKFPDTAVVYREHAKEEEVRAALEAIGILVPDELNFSEEPEGNYRFSGFLKEEEFPCDGFISCQYAENGICQVDYRLLHLTPYKEYPVLSPKEAYEQLQKGYFLGSWDAEPYSLCVTGVALSYELDSKGYYQPVYRFQIKTDPLESQIENPTDDPAENQMYNLADDPAEGQIETSADDPLEQEVIIPAIKE